MVRQRVRRFPVGSVEEVVALGQSPRTNERNRLLVRFFQHKRMGSALMIPRISIIICTSNRAEHLRQTLQAMGQVCVPVGAACELIVVDNASTDGTAGVVHQSRLGQMSIRYVREPRRGQCHARNAGLEAARGDIIVFTDDDVRPATLWLDNLCASILAGKTNAVLGGAHIAPHLLRPWMEAQHKNLLASTENADRVHPALLVGINMAFSKSVLADVPKFDVELGAGALGFADDTLFSYQLKQAGYALAAAFDAQVEHHFDPARLSRSSFLNRAVGEGRSHAYLVHHWEHREISRAPLYLIHRSLRLRYRRIQRRAQCQSTEGIALWELNDLMDVAFYSNFMKERRRPRNYEKHGLVKLCP